MFYFCYIISQGEKSNWADQGYTGEMESKKIS